GEGFRVSKDVGTVRFCYDKNGNSPKIFSISKRELMTDSGFTEILFRPFTQPGLLNITDWFDSKHPKLNGKKIDLEPNEASRSLAILLDKNGFVLGADWSLRLFDKEGKEKWKTSVPSTAWNVNVSQDGKLVVAAFGDGTIRWFRVKDGTELLAFFPHNDKKRWVLWTPSGYYDASIGAEELIGWHINRGADKEADFFPISQFRKTYCRRDVILNVLETLDEGEAIKLSKIQVSAIPLTNELPPVIKILSHDYKEEVKETDLTIKYEVRTPLGVPVTDIKVKINHFKKSAEESVITNQVNSEVNEIKVTIKKENCVIDLIAINENGWSVPSKVKLIWAGEPQKDDEPSKLYILAIGIDTYEDNAYGELIYSPKDADDFVDVMKKQEGKLYTNVEVKILKSYEATQEKISDGLAWLKENTKSNYTAMVFFSGHGVNEGGKYYCLPVDVVAINIENTAISFTDIIDTFEDLLGKQFLFLDACYSGSIFFQDGASFDTFMNIMKSYEIDATTFSSSRGSERSFMIPEFQNSAFTKAVVEGIEGNADYNRSGRVTVKMLDLYISMTVPELVITIGKTQNPVSTITPGTDDYIIARLIENN
ncbi:MAG: caspase family protein, partial [Nitrospirae bacterium]|nr:caspase family protein [Nitrospirota bacterium]